MWCLYRAVEPFANNSVAQQLAGCCAGRIGGCVRCASKCVCPGAQDSVRLEGRAPWKQIASLIQEGWTLAAPKKLLVQSGTDR